MSSPVKIRKVGRKAITDSELKHEVFQDFRYQCHDNGIIKKRSAVVFQEMGKLLNMTPKAVHMSFCRAVSSKNVVFETNVTQPNPTNVIAKSNQTKMNCNQSDSDSNDEFNFKYFNKPKNDKFEPEYRKVRDGAKTRFRPFLPKGWTDEMFKIIINKVKLPCNWSFKGSIIGEWRNN